MTHAERSVMERAAPSGVALRFVPDADPHFVRLQAAPCPLYDGQGCSIYEHRPFNCRRFACVREDYTQPYDPQGRELTREQRRRLIVIQRHAQRWARSHGWAE